MPDKAPAIKAFKNLDPKNKNICFLYSKNRAESILAYSPIDKYSGSNISALKEFIKKNKGNLLIGYLSYDLAYKLHEVKRTAKNDLKLPEIFFLAFDKFEKFKIPRNQKIKLNTNKKLEHNFKAKITPSNYHKAFKKIQNYLREGEIYQINLTHRLESETKTPPRDLFLKIINQNPENFLTYMEGDGFEILSASPERFIRISQQKIETYPIKGTRPRGKTPNQDQKHKQELLKSPKEKAELNMITDLLRNDLGKICQAGSIKVQGHRLIQKHQSVWHTYSKITGKLALPAVEGLISMLPGGSITGCPKKRAIEIIDELEVNTRGIYTGVIGYISPNQKELDFSIVIRTIIKKSKKLYLQVGGGIVIDSKESREYQETLAKAKSLLI